MTVSENNCIETFPMIGYIFRVRAIGIKFRVNIRIGV